MISRVFHFFVVLFVCGILVPLHAHALSVESVRFGVHQDTTRMVLDLDGPAQFRAFVLDAPYRMVIDLPAFEWKAGDVQGPAQAGVSGTRHGNLKPGVSRIVFDMNRPISIQKAFMLPGSAGTSDRLVIDFANVPPSLFAQTRNKIHGTLDSAQTAHAPPAPASKPSTSAPPVKHEKPLVIIDPGHGGIDPGAIGPAGIHERDVVLALGKELKRQLEASGKYRVHMTRDQDHFIKLSQRVKIARRAGGDLFISIHADSIGNKGVQGASIYTLSEKASDAQTAKLAARENKADLIAGIDLNVEDKDVANILMDLAMRDTMNQSKFFANMLVGSFQENGVKLLPRPHRYAGFAVLKAPDIPSVLVEAGFMSNSAEANRLSTPNYRKKIAGALKKGVDRYFEQVRKNQRL